MGTGEGPSQASTNTREDTIQVGNTLLLKLPSGDIKTWKLEKDLCDHPLHLGLTRTHRDLIRTANLGKFGSFHANELVGQPFGLTYEIADKKLKVVPPRTLQEVGMGSYKYLRIRLTVFRR